jgi:hypothetical protein
MATDDYVPVAGDDWYQRRRQDAEGVFFRRIADQAGRRGEGGSNRQGIYCFTASGKLLAARNHQDADSNRDLLEKGLAAWNRLPDDERRPGAVKVPDPGKIDTRYTRTPPAGGLILNVYTRILDRDRGGKFLKGTCEFQGGALPARDHLWLRRSDWQRLVPADAKKGDQFPMPPAIAERLLLYHLVDNTRGEPTFWRQKEVRRARLTWTVERATEESLRLRLDGRALLATAADPARADRGFDARILGYLHYDRARQTIDRLDIVAVGDHWGEGAFTAGARPGRKPLGVAFELSRGDHPADKVPPQAARDWEDYLGRQR